MRSYNFILAVLLSLSFVRSDDVYFNSVSTAFVIDTSSPEINVTSPLAGDSYGYDESIRVEWNASDDTTLGDNSIEIFLQAGMSASFNSIALPMSNSGSYLIPVSNLSDDDIDNAFNHILIWVTDYYGNLSSGLNPGYFTIGNPDTDYSIDDVETSLSSFSSTFEIDTKIPEISVISPNENTVYLPGTSIQVEWDATDDNLVDNSISIKLVSDYFPNGQLYGSEFENDGTETINLPNISTNYAKISISAQDAYGFSGTDESNSYFIIGVPYDYELEENFEEFDGISSNFIMDTKIPEFLPLDTEIDDNVFFYPNGGNTQIFENYASENVQIQYNVYDDSPNNAHLGLFQSYILGGWYIPIALDLPLDATSIDVDLSKNGLIENSIWAKLKFRAVDGFGNVNDGIIDDYFVLGDPDGDLDINWVDEDDNTLMISWAWEPKHAIMIVRNAFADVLEPGDKITLVDNQGINSSSCDDPYGYTELKEITINDEGKIGGPKSVLKGIDHCDQEGAKRVGFIDGNPIIFKITHAIDATTYYVYPDVSTIVGHQTYSPGGHTVVRNIDFANPVTIDSNNSNLNTLVIDDRGDFESFNVYYRANGMRFRDCVSAATGNNDSDGDGASDDDWCYEQTVEGETDYQHQLQPAIMDDANTVSYRVWLLDNADSEVYKTIDQDVDININLSNIYDTGLEDGWSWFSVNMIHEDMGLNNILGSLTSPTLDDYIKSQGEGYSNYYGDPNVCDPTCGYGWQGTLAALGNTGMYKIKLGNQGNITFEGTPVDVLNTPITILSGWNWIAYLPQDNLDLNTAFASMAGDNVAGDYIKSQGEGYADYYGDPNVCDPTCGYGWQGTLTALRSGTGYMLDVANATTLIYPESGLFSLASKKNKLVNKNHASSLEFDHRKYEYNGTITLALDLMGIEPAQGDKITAYHKDEQRGFAFGMISPMTDKLVFPMMFYSNKNNEELTFTYYNSKNNEEIELVEKIIFAPDIHLNDMVDPYVMTNEHPLTYSLSNAYPNPFNPTTTIGYSIADDVNNLNISIYDIRGRLVDRLYSGIKSKGEYEIIWNATHLASGVYFVHMVANDFVFNKKVMLIK